MSRKPRTGMERLLRLREIQIASARRQAESAESALREAEQAATGAHCRLNAFAQARHIEHGQPTLNLTRYAQLLEGQTLAAGHAAECDAESMQRQREAEQATCELHQRLRQKKAVGTRHGILQSVLEQAIESKRDAQLCDLWQNTQAKP
jgi:hypothetical protein